MKGPPRTCVICAREAPARGAEDVLVRSNVRAFRHETFAFWRCRHCRSIHARDELDLARYYAKYPFHDLPSGRRLDAIHRNELARLERAGVGPEHRILDYGCGGGHFVAYLRARGFSRVSGFDAYQPGLDDRRVLDERYDCIICQDVIEHVPEPHALVAELHALTRPGAVIALGTPDASVIDLERPEDFVHTLHAPYHRHILSKEALVEAGRRVGWRLERLYPTMYSNTRVPFLNEAFYRYYMRINDDTLDALVEPVKVGPLLARAPLTLFWGLFGAFFSRGNNVTAVFRRP